MFTFDAGLAEFLYAFEFVLCYFVDGGRHIVGMSRCRVRSRKSGVRRQALILLRGRFRPPASKPGLLSHYWRGQGDGAKAGSVDLG